MILATFPFLYIYILIQSQALPCRHVPTSNCCHFICMSMADPGGGGGGGATGVPPPPPQIGSTVIFYNPFCIRMLKNRAQIALEIIKNP